MALHQLDLAAVTGVGALEGSPLSPHRMALPSPDPDPVMRLQTAL